MKEFLYIAFAASLFAETIKIMYKSIRLYRGFENYKINPVILFIVIFLIDFGASFFTIILKELPVYYLLFIPLLTFCVSIVGYRVIIRTTIKGLEKIGNFFSDKE